VYLVVDSATYACVGQEVEKSATATWYSRAIAAIGLPALTLAHVTKADASPQHPFGSVFWSNGARLTIGMSRADDGQTRVLQARKVNARPAFPKATIDWSWSGDMAAGELPPTLEFSGAEASRPEHRMIAALMGAGLRGLTMAELKEVVDADGDDEVSIETLRSIVKRDRKRTVRAFAEIKDTPNRVRTALGGAPIRREPQDKPSDEP
jgi:hypothetical protein